MRSDQMPVAVCSRCNARFKSSVKAMHKKGYFPLCAVCRADISKTMELKYLCIGVNSLGKQCGHIRLYDRKTCCNHHDQESKDIL